MSAIRVLRRPQFRRGFLANTVSSLGNNVATVAVAFAILTTRHSAVDLGIVLAARLVPLAVLSVVGGAWADRLSRRGVMVASDLVRLATQGGFALVLLLPDPSLWAIVALQAVNGAATAFFNPAASGLIQEIVPPAERQSAWALLSASNNVSSIIGPGIGAALIALTGNAWALGVDALSFGLSAVLLVGVRVPARQPDARRGLLREIGEGIRVVARRRWIGLEILSFSLFQFLPLAAYGVLGPLVAQRDYDGAVTWALVAGLGGIGAVVGDLVALRIHPSRPLIVSNGVMIACLPLLLGLAFGAPLGVLLAGGVLWGFALSLSDTLWLTTLQQHVPANLMARVSSLDWMGSLALRPLGVAVLPLVAAGLGTPVVLFVVAAIMLVTTVGPAALPVVARVRAAPPESEGVAATEESSCEPDAA